MIGGVFVDASVLGRFLVYVGDHCRHAGTLYLLGETGLVFEGWVRRAELIEIASEVPAEHQAEIDEAVAGAASGLGARVIDQSPGELIPLPAGYPERCRDLGLLRDAVAGDRVVGEAVDEADAGAESRSGSEGLRLAHFDPYSVAFRHIARGDEPDYHVVLHLLERRWIDMDEMDAMLEALLPSFSMDTIHQDPAEFRRKYHGLQQMWRALRAGMTHRPTAV